MANPITFTTAQQTFAAGTYEVPTAAPYPQIPAGYTNAELQLAVATTDYQNANNTITSEIYASDDGVVWFLIAQSDWFGGKVTSRSGIINPPQILSLDISGWSQKFVKGAVTLNNKMTLSYTLTLT